MNSLFVVCFAALAAITNAGVIGGHGAGAIVAGPSGIVTPHGPIGPHGLGLGAGLGYAGHGAIVAGPALGLGYAGLGLGHGLVGYGAHGVAIKGPATVPAVIAGPSGKIVAEGLYGVPHYGHGLLGLGYGYGHGHW